VDVAILLIGFNRPELIIKTLNSIRAVKPSRIYITVDGARANVVGEQLLVDKVKEVVQNIDWLCDVNLKFNEVNMGAEVTVSAGVSWVLENEESVIVMEDDIVASLAFFQFCEEMLEKYKDNENIYMVSGCQITPIKLPNNEDYLFGLYGHTGAGWATWKRAWNRFNLYMDVEDGYTNVDYIKKISRCREEEYFISDFFRRMQSMGKEQSTWDYCWFFIRLIEQGMSIIPRVNLTSDIGEFGLHARGRTENHHRSFDDKFTVQLHPNKITCNEKYDIHHLKTYLFQRNMFSERIRRSKLYLFCKKFYLKVIKNPLQRLYTSE